MDDKQIREAIRGVYDVLTPSEETVMRMKKEMQEEMKQKRTVMRWSKLAVVAACLALVLAISAVAVVSGLQLLQYRGKEEGMPVYGVEVAPAAAALPEELSSELRERVRTNVYGDLIMGEIHYPDLMALETATGIDVLAPVADDRLVSQYYRVTGGVANFDEHISMLYDCYDEDGYRIGDFGQEVTLNQEERTIQWAYGSDIFDSSDAWVETSYVTVTGIGVDIVYNTEIGQAYATYCENGLLYAAQLFLHTEEVLDTIGVTERVGDERFDTPQPGKYRIPDPDGILTNLQQILDTLQ